MARRKTKDRHPPYMPHHVQVELDDVNVQAMTLTQFGAHRSLINLSWSQDPPGTVPNDDHVLAKWLHIPVIEWVAIKDGVMTAWRLNRPGNRWRQKRVAGSYREVQKRMKANRENAEKRWSRAETKNDTKKTKNSKLISKNEGSQNGQIDKPPDDNGLQAKKGHAIAFPSHCHRIRNRNPKTERDSVSRRRATGVPEPPPEKGSDGKKPVRSSGLGSGPSALGGLTAAVTDPVGSQKLMVKLVEILGVKTPGQCGRGSAAEKQANADLTDLRRNIVPELIDRGQDFVDWAIAQARESSTARSPIAAFKKRLQHPRAAAGREETA